MREVTLSDLNDTHDPASRISRRRLLQMSGATALALPMGGLLSACGRGSEGSQDQIVYAGFGGTYEEGIVKAQLEPTEKKTGISVEVTTGADQIAKIRRMVEADRTKWDVVDATGPAYGQLLANDLMEKVDTDVVKATGISNKKLVDAYGVPQYAYPHCIFWNTEISSEPMTSWKDVWDTKKFPGKRGFQRNPWYMLEAALMADGVPPDKVYPLDLPRALKMLDKIRPHAVFQDLNTLQNLVAQGDIVTGDLNLARVQALISDGTKLEYIWNQNLVDYERFVVLKGAPHKKAAMKFIAATLRPERQLAVLETLGYTPTLTAALDKVEAKRRRDLAGTPETLKTGLVLDSHYYAEHGAKAQKAVQDWLIKG